jgi:hypothetical protein
MKRREFLSWGLYGVGMGVTAGMVERVAANARAARAPYRRMRTHIAGAPYRIGLSTQVDDVFKLGQRLRAVRERQNGYDRHAVALYLDDWHVGYVPRDVNRHPEAVLAAGGQVGVEVIAIDPDNPWDGVSIELTWIGPLALAAKGEGVEGAG